MQPTYLQSIMAFLCMTGSLIVIGSDRQKMDTLPLYSRPRPIQKAETPFWLGEPTSELESQIHFYMQPTARKVSQRD